MKTFTKPVVALCIVLALMALASAAFAAGDVEINWMTFPDYRFRIWALNSIPNDDGVISAQTIANTTSIDCSGLEIRNLQGLAYFTELRVLDCSKNRLSELDMRDYPKLTSLSCQDNQITSLNVRESTALIALSCEENYLPELDVQANTALENLFCEGNSLTSLDLSNNLKLTSTDSLSQSREMCDLGGGSYKWTRALSNLADPGLHYSQVDLPPLSTGISFNDTTGIVTFKARLTPKSF